MINLRKLNLSYCYKITKLNFLQFLTNLSKLNLNSSKYIENESMKFLLPLTNLLNLNLRDCNNFIKGNANFDNNLKQLTNLTNLNLEYCDEITDKNLVFFRYLTNLQNLNLGSGNKITRNLSDRHKFIGLFN